VYNVAASVSCVKGFNDCLLNTYGQLCREHPLLSSLYNGMLRVSGRTDFFVLDPFVALRLILFGASAMLFNRCFR
jgi:hypothetical protein